MLTVNGEELEFGVFSAETGGEYDSFVFNVFSVPVHCFGEDGEGLEGLREGDCEE